jgi:hypothetical protein|tara:strand:- start:166 stop:459 length:294 start_codon:yes stop_codon:yes gene_type:complete
MPENYTYVSRGKEQWASIMITKGDYEGIIYQYGRVSVADKENEDGTMPLAFNYQIIDSNGHAKETLDDSVDFKNTIGDILVDIIDEQMEAGNLAYND